MMLGLPSSEILLAKANFSVEAVGENAEIEWRTMPYGFLQYRAKKPYIR